MKNHKKHIVITTMIMILTIMLIMLSAMLSGYDSIEPIEKYLYEYEPDRLNMNIKTSYTNTFLEEKNNYLYLGDYFDSTLADTSLLDNKIKIIEEQYIDYNMTFFSYCNVFLLNDDYRICNDIEIAEGEVVITDYIAKKMNIASDPVGKTLTIGSREYTVKACIDSVADETLDSKFNLFDDNQDAYENYYVSNFYNAVYINESDFVADKKENSKAILLNCADFLNYKYERYYTRTVTVGSVNQLEGQELLCGEYPKNANEILISAEYAYENGFAFDDGKFSDEIFSQTYYFKDIHNGFNNFFSDKLDISNHFEGTIRIVGIYTNDKCNVDYLVSDEVYKSISDEYYEKYFYTTSILYLETSDYADVISHIKKYDSALVEPSIAGIYDFELLIEIIKDAILFLLLVLTTIAVFMIYHNINISISYNKKTIGVLRSIGVTKKCTMKLFMVEAILICSLSSILATAFGVGVMNIVNNKVRADVKINPYDILVWDWPMSLIIVALTFAIFIFTAIVPIVKYGKKAPIQVIRNN